MTTMQTQRFSRRPFDVEAVQVKKGNMEEVAEWCNGAVVAPDTEAATQSYIQVDVLSPANERQSRAFPGDWVLLLEGGKSFKVYTPKAFNKNFVVSENQEPSSPTQKVEKKQGGKRQDRTPSNGIKSDARDALRKMGEAMQGASKRVADPVTAPAVELTTEQMPVHSHEPVAQDSPELQVVERPVENTTEPKLEVTDQPQVQPTNNGRKFKQV